MFNQVTNTQGSEIVAYVRGADLHAGNSLKTLAKIPGSLHFRAGLMLTPASQPEQPFTPSEQASFLTPRVLPARAEARGLPLSFKVFPEQPNQGTVSLFN